MAAITRFSTMQHAHSQPHPYRRIQNATGGATASAPTLASPQYPMPSARRRGGSMFVMYAPDAVSRADQKTPCTITSASISR